MVTDTAMVRKEDKIYAFGPVVRELDVFSELFEGIEWIGFDRPDLYDDPVMLPVPDSVHCVLLTRSGGDTLLKKLGVVMQTPSMLWHIFKRVRLHEVIHSRAPSTPAFLALIVSFFFQKKVWWHKYAGNWGQINPPFFFGFQRGFMKFASWSKVTINGRWPGQAAHCLSFENPCIEEEERRIGAEVIGQKNYDGVLQICFVGRLEVAKGIDRLMDALDTLADKNKIAGLHLIGDGPLRSFCEAKAGQLPFETHLHGFQSRAAVGRIMASCHILVLPSLAEGFPKVVAEGANYGCVPVVSDISSISQYIQQGVNGFLLSPERLEQGLLSVDLQLILTHPNLKSMALAAYQMAGSFTFERYRKRIQEEILLE